MGDLKHGKGIMEFVTNNIYDGNWKQGMFHGNGKMHYAAGSITLFDGEWQKNMKTGKGIMHYANGDIFEGYFKDDLVRFFVSYQFSFFLIFLINRYMVLVLTLSQMDH